MLMLTSEEKQLVEFAARKIELGSYKDGDTWDLSSVLLFKIAAGEKDVLEEVVEKASMYDSLCK